MLWLGAGTPSLSREARRRWGSNLHESRPARPENSRYRSQSSRQVGVWVAVESGTGWNQREALVVAVAFWHVLDTADTERKCKRTEAQTSGAHKVPACTLCMHMHGRG